MTTRSIILVGGPDSGKTNYIGRLWLSFRARKGGLQAVRLPDNIQYVDDAVKHLMAGKFAPRSERNMEEGRRDFTIEVGAADGTGETSELVVPDITGELWKRAVETYVLPEEWMSSLRAASGAILFVRAHSKHNAHPMDWVTARDLLKLHELDDEDGDIEEDADPDADPIAGGVQQDGVGPVETDDEPEPLVEAVEPIEGAEAAQAQAQASLTPKLPTQVALCELVRYLELLLSESPAGGRPRVAVLVSAWDMLDWEARAAGPMAYLEREFPLFAGRLLDTGKLNVRAFGVSIVGGDLRDDPAFRESVQGKDVSDLGYVVVHDAAQAREDADVTLPIAWALGR